MSDFDGNKALPFGLADALAPVLSPFERASYYNGTTPFNKPTGRLANLPVESIHGVFDTPLNKDNVWIPLGLQIVQIIKARKVSVTGRRREGEFGSIVIWVGVKPGTTSSETAHEVSLEILGLLKDKGIEGVVIEWTESVLQRLAGPPLLPAVTTFDATHHIHCFLTPLHGVSLAAEDMEREDAQGTLTRTKVFGVTNYHVLRRDPTVDYEHRGGAPMSYVRICGATLQSKSADDNTEAIKKKQWYLDRATEGVNDLSAFHLNATTNWSHISLHRNIGYTQFAPAITVDEGGSPLYLQLGCLRNVVSLEVKRLQQLNKMFYPIAGGPTTFKFLPLEGKVRIEGWSTLDELAVPEDIDSKHQCFVMVAKDDNTTDLTVGQYTGLVSFTENDVGHLIEISVYNSGPKTAKAFPEKGDSGALVWHMKKGKAFIIDQLHSGQNKGGSTTNHVLEKSFK
ncbi:hypothetical protein F5148DRAFT_1301437 [Russula earlei]|uniref:Uncharacterized protein n=1 Tax=Russula earlei TaxID=71964 RepID=A0ACC0TTG2_9AGAM|nr:hypothetical protein F5148DRAFT_1301437 [Russula earlei]